MMSLKSTLALLLCAASLSAQIEEDPRKKMQRILDKVAEEMTQIDKWLQQSSRGTGAAKEGMKRNVAELDKLLEEVGKSQSRVVQGIDDLLKEAQRMKQQQQQQQQQKQQKQQQQQQGSRNPKRRIQQPQQMQQRQQQQQQNQTNPQDRNQPEPQKPGEQRKGPAPRKGATGKTDARSKAGKWGDLPDYILKHGRGSMPEVPEKYRKYLEALTKPDKKR